MAPLLVHGFGECMQDSLLDQSPYVPDIDSGEAPPTNGALSEAGPTDDRSMLVLQLLLGAVQGPAPNFAHFLLGFDVEDGPEGAHNGCYLPADLLFCEQKIPSSCTAPPWMAATDQVWSTHWRSAQTAESA